MKKATKRWPKADGPKNVYSIRLDASTLERLDRCRELLQRRWYSAVQHAKRDATSKELELLRAPGSVGVVLLEVTRAQVLRMAINEGLVSIEQKATAK